jgi:hypothetical protein
MAKIVSMNLFSVNNFAIWGRIGRFSFPSIEDDGGEIEELFIFSNFFLFDDFISWRNRTDANSLIVATHFHQLFTES